MRIRCPACGRANEEADRCGRCGCDLFALRRIRKTAERELARGSFALRQGFDEEALDRAAVSWRLERSPQAARLAFLASLALGRQDEAAHWWSMGSRISTRRRSPTASPSSFARPPRSSMTRSTGASGPYEGQTTFRQGGTAWAMWMISPSRRKTMSRGDKTFRIQKRTGRGGS